MTKGLGAKRWATSYAPAIILLCAAAACSRPAPASLVASTPFALARERGQFVRADDLSIFAITVGSGRDVVLLHGNPSSVYTWRRVIDPLSTRYRVHAIDLPGYGFSDKPDMDYSAALLARYVSAYMDAAGIERAVIVGNSMGGEVATELAALYPRRVAALALLAPAGLPAPTPTDTPIGFRLATWPGIGALLPILPIRPLVRASLEASVYDRTAITNDDVDVYTAALQSQGGAHAFLQMSGRKQPSERTTLIAGLRVPTLVVVGDADRVIDPAVGRRHHELIRGSRFVALPDTGHLPQEEQPQLVVEAIEQLIDSLPPPRR